MNKKPLDTTGSVYVKENVLTFSCHVEAQTFSGQSMYGIYSYGRKLHNWELNI